MGGYQSYWEIMVYVIIPAGLEALGMLPYKGYENCCLCLWNSDTAWIINCLKQAYLKYLSLNSDKTQAAYKLWCTNVRREVRKIKRNSWDHKVHSILDKAYKILKHLLKDKGQPMGH